MKTTLVLALLFVIALGGGYYWYQGNKLTPNMDGEANGDSYTLAQVAAHNTAKDCWAVVEGGVYDLSAWIAEHPGGEAAILNLCGKDGTEAFKEEHERNPEARAALSAFRIGTASE